ncbi:MAG: hypothetical protein JWM36_1924 [Hyphomicrobiales bacterium]|nr:hypothetical protein [Hyphomicrobiales bacterium]
MKLAFYGSSLLSSYWNGAATYYRGMLRDLAARGYEIHFYEPNAFERQSHRDMEAPDWAQVHVYDATEEDARRVIEEASSADIVVKASGVGVFDDMLIAGVMAAAKPGAIRIFWDVDAPATLAEISGGGSLPLRRALPSLDIVFTYGGGPPVVSAYEGLGARRCVPIYNALSPETHHREGEDAKFAVDLAFLGNRLPDREARVDEFFLRPAALLPRRSFLIGGSGWGDKSMPPNVRSHGHVYTHEHNRFNSTPLAVLNIARDSMATTGYSPATRVFEAAGAGACIITDAWVGIENFLEPGREILVAHDGDEVAALLADLTPQRARSIGEAARLRVLADHTYEKRGAQVDFILRQMQQHGREKVTA